MRTRTILLCGLGLSWWTVGSGCAMRGLEDRNRILRDSNDRLIVENNRLEARLAGVRKSAPPPTVTLPVEVRADPSPVRASTAGLREEFLLDESVEVARTQHGVRIRVPDRVFFGPGQVKLTPQGQRVLDSVARLIKQNYPENTVRVDGHTDDTPTRKVRQRFPTNWELSTARACTVVRYLVEHGDVAAGRIFPAGFSYYRPVSGYGPTARERNRRVEILILDSDV